MQPVASFLQQLAEPNSRFGGGSVTALTVASAAALLEKFLTGGPKKRIRAVRNRCAGLVKKDAEVFAGVVKALRSKQLAPFKSALNRATAVQVEVREYAKEVATGCRTAKIQVPYIYHSDLACALSLALTAAKSAQGFIRANEAWLRRKTRDARDG